MCWGHAAGEGCSAPVPSPSLGSAASYHELQKGSQGTGSTLVLQPWICQHERASRPWGVCPGHQRALSKTACFLDNWQHLPGEAHPFAVCFGTRGAATPARNLPAGAPRPALAKHCPGKREKKSFRKEDKNGDFCLGLIFASRQASLPGGRL